MERYRILAQVSPDILLFVRQADGRILEANAAAVRAYGYTTTELLGLRIHDLRAEDTRAELWDQMTAADREGILFETRHRRKDGTAFPVEVSSRGVTFEGSRVLVSIIRDISDRKRAEEERDSAALFPIQNPHPVFRVAGEGVVLYANAASQPLFRAWQTEARVPARIALPLQRALGTGVSEEIEEQVEGRHYALTCVPFAGHGYVNVYGRDITEAKQAEERLRRALADKEVLLREVHHRTKNNLQMLSDLLYLQALACAAPEAREALEESIGRLQAMARLHDLLYRALESGRIRLGEYLTGLVGEFRKLHQQVRLEADIAEEVTLDVDRAINCGLIVNELLTNAIKHAFPSGATGEAGVRVRRDAHHTVVQVWDRGKSLPEHVTLRTATSLGLRIVRILAAGLHASVRIDREKGTSFTLTFATRLDEAAASDATAPPEG